MKGLQLDGLRKLRSGKTVKGTAIKPEDAKIGPPQKTKRVAKESPNNAPQKKKRTAFGDITNAVVHGNTKAVKSKIPALGRAKVTVKQISQESKVPAPATKEIQNSSSSPKPSEPQNKGLFSDSLSWTDKDFDTLLTLEDDSPSSSKTPMPSRTAMAEGFAVTDQELSLTSTQDSPAKVTRTPIWRIDPSRTLPVDVREIDKDEDPSCVAEYVESVFAVMKRKEESYILRRYSDEKAVITPQMRTILVDWLVEVQENFELHHETLYLAVKLLDHYLQGNNVSRDKLQLVAASALFISCKLEERYAPPLDDFVFICDDAYRSEDFLRMEGKILSAVDYDLNIPISYRFLRRYARIAATSMETLTLARYMLELSLHVHDFVDSRDSKLAAAALVLAFKMTKSGTWDNTLCFYAGYRESDLTDFVQRLNSLLKAPQQKGIKTVINKYSHPVFFQVAKIPALDSISSTVEKVTITQV